MDRGNIAQPSKTVQIDNSLTGQNSGDGLTIFGAVNLAGGFQATEANMQQSLGRKEKIIGMIVRADTFTLNVNAVFTVRKNGVDTGLTVTLTAAQTDYEINETVEFEKTDLYSLEMDTTGSASGDIQWISVALIRVR